MKSRVLFLFSAFALLFVFYVSRVVYLHLWPHEKLSSLKQKQYETHVSIQSQRGALFDRFGKELAVSTTTYSLFADPHILQNKKQVAKFLSQKIPSSYTEIYSAIKPAQKRFVWLYRQLDKETAEKNKRKRYPRARFCGGMEASLS